MCVIKLLWLHVVSYTLLGKDWTERQKIVVSIRNTSLTLLKASRYVILRNKNLFLYIMVASLTVYVHICPHCPIFPYLTCHLAPFPLFIDVCKKEPTFLVFVYKINIFYGDTMKMRRCWRNHITHACLILKSTVNEEEKQFHINRSCVSYGEYL